MGAVLTGLEISVYYLRGRGVFAPNFDNSGINYQKRNRALFECIRERC
jgi:hypothetical protein